MTKNHRGLGALIVEKFAAEGCNVAINYNQSEDRARSVAERVEKAYDVKCAVLQGVRDPESDGVRILVLI